MNSKILFTVASVSISVHKSQDSSVGIVTRLQAGWSYSGHGKKVFHSPKVLDWVWDQLSLIWNAHRWRISAKALHLPLTSIKNWG